MKTLMKWLFVALLSGVAGAQIIQPSGGVSTINGSSGAFTFSGAGVSCVGTTCTFNGGGALPTNALVYGLSSTTSRAATGADISATLGYTPAAITPTIAGATADYKFLNGSGTTLSDLSGNGNNGTLCSGSGLPTWTLTGLSFTAYQNCVTLPSALNGTNTFYFAVYINPLTNTTGPTNQYPVLLSSSLGGSGLNLMYDKNGVQLVPSYALDIYSANAHNLQSPNLISGFHVLTFVLGTGGGNLNHAYIDGTEVSYTVQNSSSGAQSSGNLFFGTSGVGPFTTSGFLGTLYRGLFYSGQHSASQVAMNVQAILSEVSSRGVATSPLPLTQSDPQFFAAGTSITSGLGLSAGQAWPSNLTLTNQPSYTIDNYGIPGILVESINGSEANRGALFCRSTNGTSVYNLLAGDNDYGNIIGATAASVYANIATTIQTMKQAGCIVFAGTIISRTGTSPANGGTFDSFKDALDPLILSSAIAGGATGVIDFAADPNMGCDGCNSNTTYFQSDHTHPTATGALLLAAAASNTLNYYLSTYSVAQPHVYTAGATLISADKAVQVGTLSGAAAFLMPSCIGPTGVTYTFSNPQSSFAVTLQGGSASQPINGLTTAITIPANSTATLQDMANPKSTAGCYWAANISPNLPTFPTGAIVGTTDTQTLTNKTVDGVTPAIFAFLDATSSIQTQLNGKAAAPVSNAITSATPGTGVTSVTCATASCTNLRGTYTVVGGTATTGTIFTLVWPTTTTAYVCTANQNDTGVATAYLGLGHSVATATGMTVSAGISVLGSTFNVDYACQP